MLKLVKYAVASKTTFITAKCHGDAECPTHVFAKDASGWHELKRDSLLKRTFWADVDANILLAHLDILLTAAEAEYLKEKRA